VFQSILLQLFRRIHGKNKLASRISQPPQRKSGKQEGKLKFTSSLLSLLQQHPQTPLLNFPSRKASDRVSLSDAVSSSSTTANLVSPRVLLLIDVHQILQGLVSHRNTLCQHSRGSAPTLSFLRVRRHSSLSSSNSTKEDLLYFNTNSTSTTTPATSFYCSRR
jgi:hypothetical protein